MSLNQVKRFSLYYFVLLISFFYEASQRANINKMILFIIIFI